MSDSWQKYGPVLSTFSNLVWFSSVVLCLSRCRLWCCLVNVFVCFLVASFSYIVDHSEHNWLFQWVWAHNVIEISKVHFCGFCLSAICLSGNFVHSSTFLFVISAVQGMCRDLLQPHTTQTICNFAFAYFFHGSTLQLYVAVGNMIMWTALHLMARLMSLYFHTWFMVIIGLQPSVIQCFISVLYSLLRLIYNPRMWTLAHIWSLHCQFSFWHFHSL